MKIKRFCCLYSLVFIIAFNGQPILGKVNIVNAKDTIRKEIVNEIAVSSAHIVDINYSTSMPSHMPTNSDHFEVFTWDKEIIKRVIIVEVDPIKSDEANKFIKNLQFTDLQPDNNTIYINLNCGVRRIQASLKEWTVTIADGQEFVMKGYNIKMLLYIPKSIEVRLKSNLSKISLGELTNKVSLDLRSVRLKASRINELILKANNSKIQISEVSRASIQAKHCEINSGLIHQANIFSSSFTDYRFTEVGALDIIDTKEDTFTIQELDDIQSNRSNFTNYHINKLNKKLAITCQNGDVFIDDLDPYFSEVRIDNSFSIIRIGSANVSSLLLNTHTKLSKHYLGNDIQTIDNKEELGYAVGKYFKGSKDASQVIRIECKQCEVHLR